jgi:CRISPR-associated exonuclease Cas4
VLEGTLLHQRADQPGHSASPDGEVEIRHVYLFSEKLRLSGFADVVIEKEGRLTPVEYKHGRQGKWLNDHVQLCAQALCLEERQVGQAPIEAGFIFYWGSRRRVRVAFTSELRAKTLALVEKAFELAGQATLPAPLEGKLAARCHDCSLQPMCLPDEVKLLSVKALKGGLNLADLVSD